MPPSFSTSILSMTAPGQFVWTALATAGGTVTSALGFSRVWPAASASPARLRTRIAMSVRFIKTSFDPLRSAAREDEAERAASSLPAFEFDPAAVRFDGPLGDGQAQPGPARPGRPARISPIKTIKDLGDLVRRDARAVV